MEEINPIQPIPEDVENLLISTSTIVIDEILNSINEEK